MNKIFDPIITGSGFGSSVAALRPAEKDYPVLVPEQGGPNDFPESFFHLSPRAGARILTNSKTLNVIPFPGEKGSNRTLPAEMIKKQNNERT